MGRKSVVSKEWMKPGVRAWNAFGGKVTEGVISKLCGLNNVLYRTEELPDHKASLWVKHAYQTRAEALRAASHQLLKRANNLMESAAKCTQKADEFRAEAIFLEGMQ